MSQIIFFPVYFMWIKRISSIPQHKRKSQRTERNSESIFLFIPKSIVLMVCTCHVNLLYYRYTTLFFLFCSKSFSTCSVWCKIVQTTTRENLKLKKILTKQVNNKISVTVKWFKCYMKRKKRNNLRIQAVDVVWDDFL